MISLEPNELMSYPNNANRLGKLVLGLLFASFICLWQSNEVYGQQASSAFGQSFSCPCGCGGGGGCALGGFNPIQTADIDARINSRWGFTATDGATTGTGGAVTLTWGIASEGSNIPSTNNARPGDAGSSLVNFLDGIRDNASTGGADLTQRAWFNLFQQSTNRISQLSGVTFNFESADDGADLFSSNGTGGLFAGPPGALGTRADIRIGGRPVDGSTGSNTLAFAFGAGVGETVFDTDNSAFFGNTANDSRGFRNVLTHELFHALGISHVESNNAGFLLEPFINNSFDGPQLDDILILQRNYGDFLEATNSQAGNDTLANATALGQLSANNALSVGQTVDDTRIEFDEVGFVSIDDDADIDFFEFSLADASEVLLELSSEGATYNQGTEGSGSQSALDSSALNDLSLSLFDEDGNLIAESDLLGAGITETILEDLAAGTYFVQVTGSLDEIQLYSLGISASTAIPEPGSGVLLVGLVGYLRLRRRRVS